MGDKVLSRIEKCGNFAGVNVAEIYAPTLCLSLFLSLSLFFSLSHTHTHILTLNLFKA